MKYDEAVAILDAVRQALAESDSSDEAWRAEFERRVAAEAEVKHLGGQLADMTRRQHGGERQLTRIRKKCDLASGLRQGDDYDKEGRAAGAEGAVDRLIAMYAGCRTSGEGEMEGADCHE